jgi:hypothetical protein
MKAIRLRWRLCLRRGAADNAGAAEGVPKTWAYAVNPPDFKVKPDDGTPRHVPAAPPRSNDAGIGSFLRASARLLRQIMTLGRSAKLFSVARAAAAAPSVTVYQSAGGGYPVHG